MTTNKPKDGLTYREVECTFRELWPNKLEARYGIREPGSRGSPVQIRPVDMWLAFLRCIYLEKSFDDQPAKGVNSSTLRSWITYYTSDVDRCSRFMLTWQAYLESCPAPHRSAWRQHLKKLTTPSKRNKLPSWRSSWWLHEMARLAGVGHDWENK